MNKKLLRVALLVAVVAVAGLGAHKAQAKKTTLSDIMLANVEALSSDEMNIQDLIDNCTWEESSFCEYLIVKPSGNIVWQHWNMRNLRYYQN